MSNSTGSGGKLAGRFNIPKPSGAFDWESLTFLRAIGLLKIGYFGAILIPVYAHFVTLWNAWAQAADIKFFLVLPATLFLTYLGSVLLSVGQLLNEIFCPKLVKTHGTLRGFQEYLSEFVANENAITVAAEHSHRLAVQLRADTSLSEGFTPELKTRVVDALMQKMSHIAQQPAKDEPLVGQYRDVWQQANQAFLPIRIAIAICYLVTAGIAIILTVGQIPKLLIMVQAAFPPMASQLGG